jgi:anti-sigma B factor antagonist
VTGRRQQFEINTRALGDDVLAVAPSGELDLGTVGPLSEVLRTAQGRGQAVHLDLSELTFMDSTGLALLIEVAQDAKSNGWMLRMTDPSPPVARVIAMTRTQAVLGLDAD